MSGPKLPPERAACDVTLMMEPPPWALSGITRRHSANIDRVLVVTSSMMASSASASATRRTKPPALLTRTSMRRIVRRVGHEAVKARCRSLRLERYDIASGFPDPRRQRASACRDR
jgi:hypothetical protein